MRIKSYNYYTLKKFDINFKVLKFEITRVIGENASNNDILAEFLSDPELYICLVSFENVAYNLNTEMYSSLLHDFENYLNNEA